MKIAFVSLGCDKNLVDSEIMLGLIDAEGHTITDDEANADIVIINTCGFILDATEEGIENVLSLAELKRNGNIKGLIVTGCMAQRYQKEIFSEIPEVDAVVGTGDFESIGQVIQKVAEGQKVTLITDINKSLEETLSHKRMLTTPSYVAYLKISEGCDNNCTYCTIPRLRGKYRSRTMESLIQEATILAEKGVKELILVAQDTALYGTDLDGQNHLHQLLQQLSTVEGIQWIRLLYCYPEHITEETMKEMSANPKVCHYLDMPIQHCADGVLKRMARRTTKENLKAVIARLRVYMPDISLRTTLIVGFPGETVEDFEELKAFIQEMRFNKLGVFAYSKEEGTPAEKLPDQIPEEIKLQRKDEIMELQKYISGEINKQYIGETLQVIVEGKLPEEEVFCGRSYMDCYDVDGLIFFNCPYELLSGDFVQLKITDALEYDLLGEMLDEPSQ